MQFHSLTRTRRIVILDGVAFQDPEPVFPSDGDAASETGAWYGFLGRQTL